MKTKPNLKENALRIDVKFAVKVALTILLVVGGLQGLYILTPLALSSHLDLSGVMFALVIFAFYGGCLFAAYQLWKNQDRGLRIALVLMCLQIPIIDTPTLGYRLASGFGSWLRQSSDGWTLVNNWTSCFNFSRSTGFGPNFGLGASYYGINLFAIAVVIFIWIAMRIGSQENSAKSSRRLAIHPNSEAQSLDQPPAP